MLMSGECHFLFLMATWCWLRRWQSEFHAGRPAAPRRSESGEWKCGCRLYAAAHRKEPTKEIKSFFSRSPSISQRATSSLSAPCASANALDPRRNSSSLHPASGKMICIWSTPVVTAINYYTFLLKLDFDNQNTLFYIFYQTMKTHSSLFSKYFYVLSMAAVIYYWWNK